MIKQIRQFICRMTFLQSKYARRGHGSAEIVLECGHAKYCKWSNRLRGAKANCDECLSKAQQAEYRRQERLEAKKK